MAKININFLKSITLLYVEDEDGLRDQELRAYSKLFKKVFPCEDGDVALETFFKNQDEIDIIITDINMPKVSGIEFVRQVREVSDIPVIVTTAYQEIDY